MAFELDFDEQHDVDVLTVDEFYGDGDDWSSEDEWQEWDQAEIDAQAAEQHAEIQAELAIERFYEQGYDDYAGDDPYGDVYAAQWDDDPDPYSGTYSEE